MKAFILDDALRDPVLMLLLRADESLVKQVRAYSNDVQVNILPTPSLPLDSGTSRWTQLKPAAEVAN